MPGNKNKKLRRLASLFQRGGPTLPVPELKLHVKSKGAQIPFSRPQLKKVVAPNIPPWEISWAGVNLSSRSYALHRRYGPDNCGGAIGVWVNPNSLPLPQVRDCVSALFCEKCGRRVGKKAKKEILDSGMNNIVLMVYSVDKKSKCAFCRIEHQGTQASPLEHPAEETFQEPPAIVDDSYRVQAARYLKARSTRSPLAAAPSEEERDHAGLLDPALLVGCITCEDKFIISKAGAGYLYLDRRYWTRSDALQIVDLLRDTVIRNDAHLYEWSCRRCAARSLPIASIRVAGDDLAQEDVLTYLFPPDLSGLQHGIQGPVVARRPETPFVARSFAALTSPDPNEVRNRIYEHD